MDYRLLKTDEEVLTAIRRINVESPYAVIDLETTGLDTFKDRIVDVQISGDSGPVFIFPGSLAFLLSAVTTKPVGHNLRYDVAILNRSGVDVTHWEYHDTLLMGHLVDENRESYSLDSYIKEVFNDNYKEAFWSTYSSYEEAPELARYVYGAKDIHYTRLLYTHLLEECRRQCIPESLIEHVHGLQYALLRTEISGVRVDLDYTARVGTELKARIEGLKPEMRSLVPNEVELIELEMWEKELGKRKTDKGKAGVERPIFSFSSGKQLQTLLYSHLRLPVQYNDKTKSISTDYDSLQRIRDHHPIVERIQEYRDLEKVYGTYIEGTLDRVKDGRVYPEFRVNGTKGSRISHSNPNLGQLPKTGGIKGIYIPDEGEVFSDHDYAQLEVCIEAHYTRDKNLLAIVLDGASKHDITANNLGIPRDLAKTLNFAMQYFCMPNKISQILKCSMKEAEGIYRKYWETYSGVMVLKDQTDKELLDNGYIVDWFGRRRRFPIKPTWKGDKAFRQGYNFKIQSTGGQIMNNAFYKASEWIRNHDRGHGGMWTVHDSGLFSHKMEFAEEDSRIVDHIMIEEGDVVGLEVPLKTDSVTNCERWLD